MTCCCINFICKLATISSCTHFSHVHVLVIVNKRTRFLQVETRYDIHAIKLKVLYTIQSTCVQDQIMFLQTFSLRSSCPADWYLLLLIQTVVFDLLKLYLCLCASALFRRSYMTWMLLIANTRSSANMTAPTFTWPPPHGAIHVHSPGPLMAL